MIQMISDMAQWHTNHIQFGYNNKIHISYFTRSLPAIECFRTNEHEQRIIIELSELNGLSFISSDSNESIFTSNRSREKTNHNSINIGLQCILYFLLYETNQIPAIDSIENEIALETNAKWKSLLEWKISRVFNLILMAIHEHWTYYMLLKSHQPLPLACLTTTTKTRMNKQAQNWIKLDSSERNYYCWNLFPCIPFRQRNISFGIGSESESQLFSQNQSILIQNVEHFCGKTSERTEMWNVGALASI